MNCLIFCCLDENAEKEEFKTTMNDQTMTFFKIHIMHRSQNSLELTINMSTNNFESS